MSIFQGSLSEIAGFEIKKNSLLPKGTIVFVDEDGVKTLMRNCQLFKRQKLLLRNAKNWRKIALEYKEKLEAKSDGK